MYLAASRINSLSLSLRRRSRSFSSSNSSKPTATGLFPYVRKDSIPQTEFGLTKGDNVDFVTKFEKALRKRHHSLMTELAKIEHLIDAFEKGAKRGAKKGVSRLSAAARKKISMAQKARWAKTRKAKAGKG